MPNYISDQPMSPCMRRLRLVRKRKQAELGCAQVYEALSGRVCKRRQHWHVRREQASSTFDNIRRGPETLTRGCKRGRRWRGSGSRPAASQEPTPYVGLIAGFVGADGAGARAGAGRRRVRRRGGRRGRIALPAAHPGAPPRGQRGARAGQVPGAGGAPGRRPALGSLRDWWALNPKGQPGARAGKAPGDGGAPGCRPAPGSLRDLWALNPIYLRGAGAGQAPGAGNAPGRRPAPGSSTGPAAWPACFGRQRERFQGYQALVARLATGPRLAAVTGLILCAAEAHTGACRHRKSAVEHERSVAEHCLACHAVCACHNRHSTGYVRKAGIGKPYRPRCSS